MAKNLKLWFDKKGDFLEFSISKKKGFFKPLNGDVWERVDAKTGETVGFAILNFIKRFGKSVNPREILLPVKVEFKKK